MWNASDGVEAGFSAETGASEDVYVEFLCECGTADCSETVSLTPAALEALRRTGRWVLAPGHTLSRGRETEARAAAAREDARALRAQSAQQIRRAQRNLAAARVDVGRVLVVDDSEVFRQVAHAVLSATTDLRAFGEAGSGEEAIRLLPDLKPDLVLLDVHMPGLNGVETARLIREQRPSTVVVLVSADSRGLEETGVSAGAAAVVDKRDLHPRTLDELWFEHGPSRRD